MSILFKRLLALLLIPAGLVLLVTPLPTHRRAYIEQDFVFISASPLSTGTNSDKEVPLITRKMLQPYPHILRAVDDRATILATFRASVEEPGDPLGLDELGKTLSEIEGVSPQAAEERRKISERSREMFRRGRKNPEKSSGLSLPPGRITGSRIQPISRSRSGNGW